jgi:DNA modification methylase
MNSKTSSDIKKRVKANDIFYTPIGLVKIHLNYIKEYVDENDIILDGFFGTGNYYNTFAEVFDKNNTFDYTEIELGLDFFNYDKKVNIIISNPPYSIIDKILQHSVKLEPHTISYLIGQHNLTNKRIEYMNNNGYYLSKLFFTKINEWYGMSIIVVFTKKAQHNCIDFDRTIWRMK